MADRSKRLVITDYHGALWLVISLIVTALWLFLPNIVGRILGEEQTFYGWIVVGITFLIGTMRSITVVDPEESKITQSSLILFMIPYWSSSYKLKDVRLVDLEHTSGITAEFGVPNVLSAAISNLIFNRYRYYLLDPEFGFEGGEYELYLVLQDRTRLKVYSGGSRKSLVKIGEAICGMTGARLT